MLTKTAFLIATALLIGACSSDDPDTTDELTIKVLDNSYSPAAKSILIGKTLKWNWEGSVAHSVTFSGAVTSPTQSTGTYSRLFDTPGTYSYTCLVHGAAMSGTVTVTTTSGGTGISY